MAKQTIVRTKTRKIIAKANQKSLTSKLNGKHKHKTSDCCVHDYHWQ